MLLKVFAIYDTKTMCYGPPFVMTNVGGAVRMFGDMAVDPQYAISKHPKDYMLFEIGQYDDAKAILTSTVPPRSLGFGSDYLPVKQGEPVELADDKFTKCEVKEAK